MAMNPASVDIKDLLVSNSVGTFGGTTGWGVYIGSMPDTGLDTVITLYDTGGESPELAVAIDKPSLQILVRGTEWDYINTYQKTIEIRDLLLKAPAQTINTTRYDGIWQVSDATFIEYSQNRPVFSLNFRIFREPAATGNRI